MKNIAQWLLSYWPTICVGIIPAAICISLIPPATIFIHNAGNLLHLQHRLLHDAAPQTWYQGTPWHQLTVIESMISPDCGIDMSVGPLLPPGGNSEHDIDLAVFVYYVCDVISDIGEIKLIY